MFTIFFVFRSDWKYVIEHYQTLSSQNSFQVTQKQDLIRLYSYTLAENSLSDTHAKHTAETTDFYNNWDNLHHLNLNYLWINARSWQSKYRFSELVVNHVKKIIIVQVIVIKLKLFLSSKIDAAILNDIIKNEWDKFLNAEKRNNIINQDRFDNFSTTDKTKIMNSKLLYL